MANNLLVIAMFQLLVQWKLLNVITDNVIILLMWSNRPTVD